MATLSGPLTSLASKRAKLQATTLLPLETKNVVHDNTVILYAKLRHQTPSCLIQLIYIFFNGSIFSTRFNDVRANSSEFLILISRRQILSFPLQTASGIEHKQQTQKPKTFYMLHTTTWERTHSKRTSDTADQTPTYNKRKGPEPGKGWWHNKLGRENSATCEEQSKLETKKNVKNKIRTLLTLSNLL